MSTVWVESYIKYGDRFVPIAEANAPVADPFYIEGALCISVNGQELLTLAHADLIDQLWLYVVDGLERLRRGELFETYFPDQPTKLSIRPLGTQLLLLTVQAGIGDMSVQADRQDVLTALADGAHRFFSAFDRVEPNHEFDLQAIHRAIAGH